jgi:surface protein
MKTKLLILIMLLGMANSVSSQTNFITTWVTNLNNQLIQIPTTGGGYNYDVDWENDGVFDNFGVTGPASHIYPITGIHTIAIRGSFPRIYFLQLNGSDIKIRSVEQWGNIAWSSMESAFYGCTNLKINATDAPDLSKVTDMSYMFFGAAAFNQNISSWDVSKITNMNHMFYNASSFNQDISNWNVSNVTDMSGMFGANHFNQNIGKWNVSNVTNMSFMFISNSFFNQDIGSWNVSNVINMASMFSGASSFNQDIGSWNVGNVTDMSEMFSTNSFNRNIGAWDVSKVTSMSSMFNQNKVFNQNIGKWNVGKVTSMMYMFYNASSFNQNIGSWDVSNVNYMTVMFAYASAFNQNISGWNVGNVIDMFGMFREATSFNQNIGSWDLSNVRSMDYMFEGVTLSTAIYDALLNNLNSSISSKKNNINKQTNTSSLPYGVIFNVGNSTYCNGEAARSNLINNRSWTITDGGLDCSSLGNTNFEDEAFSLYPNPTTGIVYLNHSKGNTVQVFNTLGQEVYTSKLNTNQVPFEMNIKHLQSGLYFVKVNDAEASYTKRLVLD